MIRIGEAKTDPSRSTAGFGRDDALRAAAAGEGQSGGSTSAQALRPADVRARYARKCLAFLPTDAISRRAEEVSYRFECSDPATCRALPTSIESALA